MKSKNRANQVVSDRFNVRWLRSHSLVGSLIYSSLPFVCATVCVNKDTPTVRMSKWMLSSCDTSDACAAPAILLMPRPQFLHAHHEVVCRIGREWERKGKDGRWQGFIYLRVELLPAPSTHLASCHFVVAVAIFARSFRYNSVPMYVCVRVCMYWLYACILWVCPAIYTLFHTAALTLGPLFNMNATVDTQ